MARRATVDLSVVVPVFNEEDSVAPLHEALVGALDPTGLHYEILLVDDGSGDRSLERVVEIAHRDARVRAIKLRRNYGQTPAMEAGIQEARGRIVVTMDGDLQNDPVDIPRFLEKIDEGYDIVVGWRHERQDKLLSRKVPSRIANWLIGKVTGVPIKDNGCSLKAYRSTVIKAVPLYSEMHRFIPAMSSTVGSRIAEIKVRHHARRFGESKYGLSRVYKVLLDLLVIKTLISFAYQPMVWFCALALPAAAAGFALLAYSLLGAIVGGGDFSLPLAGSGVLFCALAIFLLFGGAIGELVSRTAHASMWSTALVTAKVRQPNIDAAVDGDRG